METTSLLIIILSLTCTTVHSLTVDDFYKDTDADTIETLPKSNGRDSSFLLNLPIHISNLKDFHTVARHSFVRSGQFDVFRAPPADSFTRFNIYVLSPNFNARSIAEGTATAKASTKPELLKRALKDITDKYNVDPTVAAPTHLLLYNFNDIKASGSAQGSTFQFVLATNGQYTYGIILFVTVEPAASSDRAYMVGLSRMHINLPYASDIANAASNTNTDVPGKYVVDINDNPPPPPPPCDCKRRITALACHAIKERSGEIPRPCQEFN